MSNALTIPDIPWTPPTPRDKDGHLEERQCIAHSKQTGERCKNTPIRGGRVCRMHGGGTPVARNAAKARLLAMCEPAFGVLQELMETDGVEDSVKLKAAIAVLDRAGFTPKNQVTIKDKRESIDTLNQAQLLERGRLIMQELERRRAEVIEAQLVSDEGGTPAEQSS